MRQATVVNVIKLARKYSPALLLGVACAVGLILWFARSETQLTVGAKNYAFEVVSTPEARARGLSGRTHLGPHQAMIFAFGTTGQHCMWMKDMRFAIDIIWLSPEKHVRHIEENLAPETYPKTFCSPGSDVLYVVEVAAGQVASSGLKLGDTVSF